MKQKLCAYSQCKQPFTPWRSTAKCCSWECAHNYAVEKRIKAEARAERMQAQADRKYIRERKEKLKTRSDYMKEAQQAVNAYVRARDEGKPCISCGRHHDGQWHAGHYRSVGSAPHLRFDADRNIFRQCAPCNTHLSGNLINYRRGLIQRIGLEAVEALEADNTPRKFSTEDLKAIKAEYAKKTKELSNEVPC